MQILTLRDHQKAPLKYRWLLRLMYTLALAPAVYITYSRDMQLDMGASVTKLTKEFWQDAHWALSAPADFWPPILAFIGDISGLAALPGILIPLSSLVLAGCILGSITTSLDREGNFSPHMVIIALCLGATPLFVGPMAVGDPIFWGPGIWFFATRSMARIESRDMFQHELALGISLAFLILLDPAAPLMILGVFLLLPLILPRTSRRNVFEALVLILSPGLMMVFLQISSYAVMHTMPLVKAIRIWGDKILWSPDFFIFAYKHHVTNGISGPLPHFLRVALHVTPLLPLAFFLPTIRERKHHPGTLAIVLVLPLIQGLIYSAHAGAASHRVWLLYLTLGMIAWLSETPLAGRWGKYFTFIICLWPLAVGWVAILSK